MYGPLGRDLEYIKHQPEVPGKAVDFIYLPARGFMKARVVKKGYVMRLIDLEGKQCGDCIIWDANDFNNVLNCCMTMMVNKRWNKWRPGDGLYSKNCDRLARFFSDTTDGSHAALGAFCNEAFIRATAGVPGCVNCRDNLVAAMADYGFSARDLDWNSCITFFMSLSCKSDGSIETAEPNTRPGDYVEVLAERDIVVAISNCPSERSLSANNPSPLQVVIFEPSEGYLTGNPEARVTPDYKRTSVGKKGGGLS